MWRKALGRQCERSSRLHTRRGDLAPLGEIIRLPLTVAERFRQSDEPWMARGAIRALHQELKESDVLLELGSGSSTAWYGRRVRRVVSIEPNRSWAEQTRRRTAGMSNVEIVHADVADAGPDLLGDPGFTVVVIDHTDEPEMSRPEAFRHVSAAARLVILDDSDRPSYQNIGTEGWDVERHVAFRSRPLHPTETSLFRRR